ncbi:MAG: carboxypeptidase regulatory-like domain-containing protein [candidate division WOR-3 bacterium]
MTDGARQNQRHFLALAIPLMLPGLVAGFSSVNGGRGLFRVEDARAEGYGRLTIKSTAIYRSKQDSLRQNIAMLDLPIGLGYSFTEWLEIMGTSGYGIAINPRGGFLGVLPALRSRSYLDARVGAKACPTAGFKLPVLKLGGAFYHQFPLRSTSENLPDYPLLVGQYHELRALTTLALQDIAPVIPIAVHGNYGFTWRDGGSFTSNGPGRKWYFTGIGADLSTSDLQIFAELTGEDTITQRFSITDTASRRRLSFGARIKTGILGLSLVFDRGLSSDLPALTYTLGLSISSSLMSEPKAKTGTIVGTVVDDRTNSPLTGTVTLPQTPGYKNRQMPIASDGTFRLANVPEGTVLLQVQAPGHQPYSSYVDVEAGKTAGLTIRLKVLSPRGTLVGNVTDSRSGRPLNALLRFPGSQIPDTRTDSATGFYQVDSLPLGTLVVEAAAAEHRPSKTSVVIREGEPTTLDFSLLSLREVGSVSGTITDTRTGSPVQATVSFQDTALPKASSDMATGFYRIDGLPAGTTVITINAPGYYPAQGALNIEPDRMATQNFALNPMAPRLGQITGVVTDKMTKAPLSATIYFSDPALPSLTSDSTTGFYRADVPLGPLVVACSLPGYARQIVQSPIVVKRDEPVICNFEMIRIGTEITLSNEAIQFPSGSAVIPPDGYAALEEWVKLLKDNPFVMAEIQGHTDAVGSAEANQRLSEKRAQAVADYLVSRGIERSRLLVAGYGESRLLVPSEEASAANRRVVFRVLGEK